MIKRRVWLMLACLTGIGLSAPGPAWGIPAFARKYGVSCAMCHDPIPKLNPYGELFMANGYALAPGDTTGTTSSGDPLLVLNSTFPIAMRLDAYLRAQGGNNVRSDFQTPYVVKVLSGGALARNVSYYVYVVLAEDGALGGVEDANVTFSRLFGAPAAVTVGQFQIIDPLWKRELRITVEDYAILKQAPGTATANLTYDRGVMLTVAPTATTTVVAELVNGNGINAAGAGGTFDEDSPKTGFMAVTQQVGAFRLSVLGYYGNQEFTPAGGSAVTNRTRMVGPAVQARLGAVDVGAQYLYRDDSDPDFVGGTPPEVSTRGGFAEVNWWPRGRSGRWLVTGLYNNLDSSTPGLDYETGSVNLSWLYGRNLRLASEFTYDLVAERGILALGLVTAF